MLDCLAHRLGDFRVLAGDVGGFLRVVFQVVELDVVGFHDELPVAATQGRAKFWFIAEKDLAVGKLRLLEQVGLGTRTIEIIGIVVGDSGNVGEGGKQVEAHHKGVGS